MKNLVTAFLVFLFLLPGLLVAQSADTKNAGENGFSGPDIGVNPLELTEIHSSPGQITTQFIYLTNSGEDPLYWEIGFGGTIKGYQHEVVSARPAGNTEIIWDNGPIVTAEGVGSNGSDYSELQDASLGMTTYGSGCQISAGNVIADDFQIDESRVLTSFTFFVYQTGAGNVSTINDVRYQIYDGNPANGGVVIYGDLETNRLVSTEWSNAWRVLESAPAENRAIMEVVADATGLSLSAGNYWVAFQAGGTAASGPWCPPITITGQTNTGNSVQHTSTGWAPLIDGGPQGMPFIIEAYYSGLLPNDVSISSILQPTSGIVFTDEEPVTIRIKNYGIETQTNIPFMVSWSGPTGSEIVEGVYEDSLAYNQTVDVTLQETANLSVWGTYIFEACTQLEGDQNSANDCKMKVLFAPPPASEWLTLDASSGVMYPGQTAMIGVTFDSEDLPMGQYLDSLRLESNDPDQPLIVIPVELQVFDGLAFNHYPEDFYFELFPGQEQTDSLTIENNYWDILNVSLSITFIDENSEFDWLTITPETAEILPGEAATFEVTAMPISTWNFENYATIHITSDDVLQSTAEIPARLDVLGAVNKNDREREISIFPNPAQTSIVVTSRQPIHSVVLMNQLGGICIDKDVYAPTATLSVGDLPKGIYFIRVVNEAGQYYQKLVVQ
jgi:hypothetical protein